MSTITAPIILQLIRNTVLAAHMLFYFGIVADITPPVALAAMPVLQFPGQSPENSVIAARLAIAAFIIQPYVRLNPSMLLINTTVAELVQIVITSMLGMFAISSGLGGFMHKVMPWWQRVLAVAAGIALIDPGIVTDIIGLIVIGFICVIQYIIKDDKSTPVLER